MVLHLAYGPYPDRLVCMSCGRDYKKQGGEEMETIGTGSKIYKPLGTEITLGKPEILRICKKCGGEKTIDNFPKNKDSESGHSWICKKCRAKYDADRWEKKKAEKKKKNIPPHSSARSLLKHAGKWVGDPLEKLKPDDLLKRIQMNAIREFIENILIPGIQKMVEEKA